MKGTVLVEETDFGKDEICQVSKRAGQLDACIREPVEYEILTLSGLIRRQNLVRCFAVVEDTQLWDGRSELQRKWYE
jgi:hypothetical protein